MPRAQTRPRARRTVRTAAAQQTKQRFLRLPVCEAAKGRTVCSALRNNVQEKGGGQRPSGHARVGGYIIWAQNRYYAQGLGRFNAQDTHWHPGNMVFGDEPNALPDSLAILQSKNLYAYAVSSPVGFVDRTGKQAVSATSGRFDQWAPSFGSDGGPQSGSGPACDEPLFTSRPEDAMMIVGGIGIIVAPKVTVPIAAGFGGADFFVQTQVNGKSPSEVDWDRVLNRVLQGSVYGSMKGLKAPFWLSGAFSDLYHTILSNPNFTVQELLESAFLSALVAGALGPMIPKGLRPTEKTLAYFLYALGGYFSKEELKVLSDLFANHSSICEG